jgi:phage shock protein PspC (stress-responsive transcriptional regulator)
MISSGAAMRVTAHHKSVRVIGVWSAVLCTVFSLAYVVAQLCEWMGLLGSAGGPHSRSTTLGLAVLLTPSLLLGVSFVPLMVSIHHYAETSVKIWSHIAVAFASIYAALVSIVYYVQLAFVMPRLARGDVEDIRLLIFEPFDSFLYAVDVWGYSLMSLSTLFAAAVFGTQGVERWIRYALIANGCLVPFLALQMYYPPLIWGGTLWSLTFPTSTWLLAIHFRRLPVR